MSLRRGSGGNETVFKTFVFDRRLNNRQTRVAWFYKITDAWIDVNDRILLEFV